jgi:agmatine deiminase
VTAQTPHDLGYILPAEWDTHEGTWLQWPHDGIYAGYGAKLERIWLAMTAALCQHETVHIIANDERQRDHIAYILEHFGIGFQDIDLRVIPTDDVWVRDNGPIFIANDQGDLALTDWNFNGWGGRFDHPQDAKVPARIGEKLSLPIFKSPIVMEGGSVSVNGAGTFMATDTSIINENRNPGMSKEEVEAILRQYLGVTNFIWLSGAGQGECEKWGDATDSHIDIVARFTNESTVIYNWTEDRSDPRFPMFAQALTELKEAKTESGASLTLVPLPIPKGGVFQVSDGISWRVNTLTDGVYSNYYTANGVVLVPVYGNATDDEAKAIIAGQFPGREVVGIEVVSLIQHGGAIGCVTQPQPARRKGVKDHAL